jgi:two-component system alkaline phosphatase synthesis response regulator PhoP
VKKILFIEDQEVLRKLLNATFKDSGFSCFEAENGEEGIALAKKIHPDVILLDVMMPGITGIETCKRLRSTPIFAETPIIFLSACCQEIDKERGMDAGATDYLSKPFSPDCLVKLVNMYI